LVCRWRYRLGRAAVFKSSLVAEDRGPVADPLPERRGAADLGVFEKIVRRQLAGAETDGAHQQAAAGLGVLREPLERRAVVAGDALGHAGTKDAVRLVLPWWVSRQ